MPQPTAGDVHVNKPLTNISVAYLQDLDEFIADKVFPNVPVTKQSDRYFEYPKDQWFRTDAQKRGVGQESAGSGFEVDNTPNYFCDVYALHKDIDDQIRANVDAPLNIDADATEFVTRGLALRKEKDWASTYFTTSTWTGSTTGGDITPSTLWDASGSTPIADIRAQMASMKTKTGFYPNILLLSEDVWLKLQDNADFLDRIAITQRKIVTKDLLASVLGIEKVLTAAAVENTAKEGATASMSFLFTKDAALYYAQPRPSLMKPSAGYVFSWSGYLGASAMGNRIKRLRVDLKACDRIEGEMAYDMKQVAADLGVFFNNTIS
jgi:hypothetical protein